MRGMLSLADSTHIRAGHYETVATCKSVGGAYKIDRTTNWDDHQENLVQKASLCSSDPPPDNRVVVDND